MDVSVYLLPQEYTSVALVVTIKKDSTKEEKAMYSYRNAQWKEENYVQWNAQSGPWLKTMFTESSREFRLLYYYRELEPRPVLVLYCKGIQNVLYSQRRPHHKSKESQSTYIWGVKISQYKMYRKIKLTWFRD